MTEKKFSRRDFLKVAAVGGVATAVSKFIENLGFKPVLIPDKKFREPLKVETAEGWDRGRLQTELENAIKTSVENRVEAILELPEGEILIDKTMVVVVPEQAKVKIVGNRGGSLIKLTEEMSHFPSEYGSFATNSGLFFKDMEGELTFEGIYFDGGSKTAGKGGYKAPLSPWNTVLFIDGKGPGDKFDPAMGSADKRKGKVTLKNCSFENSETGGILAQNLAEVRAYSCQGRNLDALLTATWTNNVYSSDMYAENCLSDGVYINDAKYAELGSWVVRHARQGFDMQGIAQGKFDGCFADDCAIGYLFAQSETDQTPSGKITCHDSNSNGCRTLYSIGDVKNLKVDGCRHDNVGEWFKKYEEGDFLHAGVAQPEKLVMFSIYDWGPPGRNVSFENVEAKKSLYTPRDYVMTALLGVVYLD